LTKVRVRGTLGGMPWTPPALVGEFKSSSGRTVLQYYSVTISGTIRGVVSAPAGFELVEVLLTGFTLEADSHEAPAAHAAAEVQKFRYDPQSGDLEIGVAATLTTDGQPWTAEVTFVVVLTDSDAGRFTLIDTGCNGTAQCSITRLLAGAIPPGMQYIGLATQIWDVAAQHGAVPVNGIAGHKNALSVNPPDVWVDFMGVFRDGAWANDMFCEWRAVVIAFRPTEMTQVPTSLPNQFTMLGTNQVARRSITNQAPAPPGVAVTGMLDAFDGFTALFSQAIGGPEHPIWMLEASAAPPILAPSGPVTTYGVFMGTKYGDLTSTQPFLFQLSRAAGFLH
jgi:hypothetical protein